MTLTYSIADQNFATTKSVGILNMSLDLLGHLAGRPEFSRLDVLSNHTFGDRLKLPALVGVCFHDEAVRGRFWRIWWDQWGVWRAARRTGNQWLFLPKGFAPVLRRDGPRLAVYVHDAVHEHYWRRHPRSLSLGERVYFQKGFRASLCHANVIFTNTEFTRAEVGRVARERGWRQPPVMTLGMGFARPVGGRWPKREQIMVLTSRWPHKRSELAVAYLERWQRESGYPGTVEWVGGLPAGLSFPAFPAWRRHVRLAESEYRRLLSEARALIYFSEYEGFGMPPAEAVMAGTCPVYSDLPATREVMGSAGCCFANGSYQSFAEAMRRATEVTPAELEAWSESLLQRHDWGSVTRKLVQALQELDTNGSGIAA